MAHELGYFQRFINCGHKKRNFMQIVLAGILKQYSEGFLKGQGSQAQPLEKIGAGLGIEPRTRGFSIPAPKC
ncbi:hypothetical protein EB241_11375 [Erwinia psidii]|uniref:Uncharacterized protein n=1 Tax=Erwinia psidii TaxID=69224 RepID=A0A3N6RXP8_9GAMM|nr:hypothetical protein EB241_11375 [Erwinia psidii]